MVLEGVREMWMEYPKGGAAGSTAKAIPKERLIPKMFLRGDSVILVMVNPLGSAGKAKEDTNNKMEE